MATFALTQTRTLFSTARFSAAWPRFSAAFLPALAVSPPFQWSIPSLQSLLELIPPFLLAVPKKKVSHSRKAMRSANKGLKDKQNLVHCPGCGSPKLAHHICANCYSSVNRAWKAKAKQQGDGPFSVPFVSMED